MCSASAQGRALKDFCASLHPSLQPLRSYPLLLANIVASENISDLAGSHIMRSFYCGSGTDAALANSSAPLAFRNLDMALLSELVCAAAGMTSSLPTSTTAQLLQLVAANALSLRPLSQFPDYIQSMKRTLIRSEYDAAVQLLFSQLPRGAVVYSYPLARVISRFRDADVDRRLIDSHYSRSCCIEGCGIFALQSKINHDCSPNSQARSCTFRSACVEVVALRPIAAGDEVSISYLGPGMSVGQRNADLLSNYGFKCACSSCAHGIST
jgi:hypothetical protein